MKFHLFGIGKCPCCGRWSRAIKNRRMSCQYNDEASNWLVSCEPCYLDAEDYWAECWREYYSGCL